MRGGERWLVIGAFVMVLTDKQQKDLHLAVFDYLASLGDDFSSSTAAFQADAGLSGATPAGKGLLEKKWTSVVRLQRKVLELEGKLAAVEKNGALPARAGVIAKDSRCLPKAPPRSTLSGHRGAVTCVAFHPVFAVAVSCSEDATIKVWDYESGEFERTLKGHTNVVQHASFAPSGNMLASCSADMSIKLWDFTSFACVRTLRAHDHNVSCVLFLPSGEQLVSCSRDETIKFWDANTGYCTQTLSGVHSDWVRALALNADASLLASCGNDQTVVVWSLEQQQQQQQQQRGKMLHQLRDHEHVVECVAFSGAQTDLALRGAAAGAAAAGTGAAAASGAPAGQYIISGSRDKTVRVFAVATGECLMTFRDADNWVRSVTFHPSGKYALAGCEDKTVRVFDLKTQRCIRTLGDAHDHFVTSAAMHPTLPFFLTGSVDRTVRVWDCS